MSTSTTLAEKVLAHAAQAPEGTPMAAKEFLHLGNRAAVDQALSRLARRGALLRVGRGTYVRPVNGKFGNRAPSTANMVKGLAEQRGETIVPHGAAAANRLGLTQQVPTREVYLTSGRTRRLKVGAQVVELRHAPAWQLLLPGSGAGDVVRALAWLGPEKAAGAIGLLKQKLPPSELREVAATRCRLPNWMAHEVSQLMIAG